MLYVLFCVTAFCPWSSLGRLCLSVVLLLLLLRVLVGMNMLWYVYPFGCDKHFGCLQLVFMNKASMNILVHIFWWKHSFFFILSWPFILYERKRQILQRVVLCHMGVGVGVNTPKLLPARITGVPMGVPTVFILTWNANPGISCGSSVMHQRPTTYTTMLNPNTYFCVLYSYKWDFVFHGCFSEIIVSRIYATVQPNPGLVLMLLRMYFP